jgi:hypothetical protein
MPRNPVEKCDITFEDRYGSTTPGNLPTHKTKVCIENTINISAIQAEFPWVSINDFHFYHMKCPYSNEATINYVRDIDKASATYWQMLEVAPASRGNHTTTSGLMIKYSKGSKHGWLCVDPDCPYYQLNNRNYFYI